MVLFLNHCEEHIRHTLGGNLPSGDYARTATMLTNQAGEFFVSMHSWKWLENVEAKLSLRGKVTLTGGTWSEANKTLTFSSGLSTYSFLEGDTFEVTGGDQVTTGFYRIRSATATVLSLTDDITTDSDSPTNITGTIHCPAIALPSDFRELIAINTTSGLLKGVELTSYQDLLSRRATNFTAVGWHYAAINHAIPSTGGDPVPRMEIWPVPETNDSNSLTMFYRAGWTALGTDVIKLRMPTYCDALFLEVLTAFARGYEEEDAGSISARLVEVVSGPLMAAAVDRDASIQPDYGPVLHGQATAGEYTGFGNFNTINAPSGG
jgi:hypothetical protein